MSSPILGVFWRRCFCFLRLNFSNESLICLSFFFLEFFFAFRFAVQSKILQHRFDLFSIFVQMCFDQGMGFEFWKFRVFVFAQSALKQRLDDWIGFRRRLPIGSKRANLLTSNLNALTRLYKDCLCIGKRKRKQAKCRKNAFQSGGYFQGTSSVRKVCLS
jgi:hypothetical protein